MKGLIKSIIFTAIFIVGIFTSSNSAGLWVTYHNNDDFNISFNGHNENIKTSNFEGWLSPTVDGLKNGVHIDKMYCIDIFHILALEEDVIVQEDSTGWFDDHNRSNYKEACWLINTFGNNVNTSDEQNGLQVAIWQTIYDGQFQYLGGLNQNAEDSYNHYLSFAGLAGNKDCEWFDAKDKQDFMHPVPEPGTFGLIGLGLLGSILFLNRKK